MKRKAVLVMVLSLAVVTAGYGLVQAHGGQSRGRSERSWFGMGSGHMGGSDWGHMGSGSSMLGPGWNHVGSGNTFGFNGVVYGHDHLWRGERQVTSEEALEIAEHSLGRNPYLRIGNFIEGKDSFTVEIVTRESDELVNRLLVEKETGRVFPIVE